MDPANVNLLTEILSFHTVDDQVIYSQDLICMETTEMSNGRDSRTVCRRQTLFQKGIGNSAFEKPEIIETDIDSCSGVIHVVDEVMLYKTRAELGLPPKDAISVPKSPVPKYPVAVQTPAPTRAHVDNTCKSIGKLESGIQKNTSWATHSLFETNFSLSCIALNCIAFGSPV